MFVCCECCVLSGRRLCDELNTRPQKSYRLWCVVVCDLETSRMRRPWPALGRSATAKNIYKMWRSPSYDIQLPYTCTFLYHALMMSRVEDRNYLLSNNSFPAVCVGRNWERW